MPSLPEAAWHGTRLSWSGCTRSPGDIHHSCGLPARLTRLASRSKWKPCAHTRLFSSAWLNSGATDPPTGLEALGALAAPLVEPCEPAEIDPASLSAGEYNLWAYFQAHPGQVCSKDDLIRAVWPEEVYTSGIRDDSLAQLVHRLRTKIEPDPANPRRIQTVPGRGYRFIE